MRKAPLTTRNARGTTLPGTKHSRTDKLRLCFYFLLRFFFDVL